jgi:hypothetical protein
MVFPGKVADRPPTNEGNRPLLSHRKTYVNFESLDATSEKKLP